VLCGKIIIKLLFMILIGESIMSDEFNKEQTPPEYQAPPQPGQAPPQYGQAPPQQPYGYAP
jgi:hypothetical protein